MAIVPMADARFGEPAASAEYNKVTANVRDLDARTSTVETNQGARGSHAPLYTEITAIKAVITKPLAPTVATDTALYGDVISSRTRSECWWGESIGNGHLTVQATRSAKAFTATFLRFCVPAAGAGNGTFELKLYTGPGLNTLTERTAWSGAGLVNAAGLKQLGINSLAIAELDYVAIAILCSGWTTSPKFSSTAVGTGAQLLIGDGFAYSVFKSGQASPIPNTINTLDTGWTRANQQFWFALSA